MEKTQVGTSVHSVPAESSIQVIPIQAPSNVRGEASR